MQHSLTKTVTATMYFLIKKNICSIKFIGACSLVLGVWLVCHDAWKLLPRRDINLTHLVAQLLSRAAVLTVVPCLLYLLVFYVHLVVLNKAGPHDSVMSSAFQASLEVCYIIPIYNKYLLTDNCSIVLLSLPLENYSTQLLLLSEYVNSLYTYSKTSLIGPSLISKPH
jgi:hypothetical protein